MYKLTRHSSSQAGTDPLFFSPYNCDWEEPRECLKIRVFEMSERRAFQCTVHGGQALFWRFTFCYGTEEYCR
jgi:hypothetical protein